MATRTTTKNASKLFGLAMFAGFIWFLASHQPQIRSSVADRDSIAYWAAANLLVHHQDPYSPSRVLALQRSQGYSADKPLVFRTPPWSLWMVVPLGFLTAYSAWVVWIAILIGCLILSMRLSWQMYGDGGACPPNAFLVAGYLFAPVPACLVAGQLGLVLAAAIVLFFFSEQRYSLLAGAVLLVPFSKPHLFALLWPILAIWIVIEKKWRLVAGFVLAFSLANAITLVLDPVVFGHYREMLRQASIQNEFIPALSGVLRLLFFRRFFWAQFLPLAAGLVWSLRYYRKHRETWTWSDNGPALVVVSVLTTPYSWMTDESILLPAILQAAYWAYRSRSTLSLGSRLAIVGFALLDFLLLLILRAKIPFSTGIYFWSSLVWASWYWYAQRFRISVPSSKTYPREG